MRQRETIGGSQIHEAMGVLVEFLQLIKAPAKHSTCCIFEFLLSLLCRNVRSPSVENNPQEKSQDEKEAARRSSGCQSRSPFAPQNPPHCTVISPVRDIVKRFFIGALPAGCHPQGHGRNRPTLHPVFATLLPARPLVSPIPLSGRIEAWAAQASPPWPATMLCPGVSRHNPEGVPRPCLRKDLILAIVRK